MQMAIMAPTTPKPIESKIIAAMILVPVARKLLKDVQWNLCMPSSIPVLMVVSREKRNKNPRKNNGVLSDRFRKADKMGVSNVMTIIPMMPILRKSKFSQFLIDLIFANSFLLYKYEVFF